MAKINDGILTPHLMGVLEDRGLDVDLLQSLGLHVQNPRQVGIEQTLVMPFYREGALVHKKYRKFIPKGMDYDKLRHWQDKDGVKCFYNEDCLRNPQLRGLPLIITEGEPDTWAVLTAALTEGPFEDGNGGEIDLRRCVSVPDGAPNAIITDEDSPKYSYLEGEAAALLKTDNVPYIIIAADGDENGANLLHDLSHRLGRPRCRFVTYPKCRPDRVAARGRSHCKDLGEVLEDYGPKGVREAIALAKWIKVDGVYAMSELPPMPTPVSYEVGHGALADHYKMRLADVTFVTGVPSHGKTTAMNAIVCEVVKRYKVRAGFASFEQHPQMDHRRNLRAWHARKPHIHQSCDEEAEADAWIDDYFRFIVPSEDDDVDIEWFLEKAAAAAIQHGVKIFVLDPWNEMDHMRHRDETQTEYTGRAIKMVKKFARKFHVHVIIIMHPVKMRRGPDGEYPVPTLYDGEGSAHWYNKADAGIIIYRKNDLTYFWVQKSRYHDDIGKPGAVSAYYSPGDKRFVGVEEVFTGQQSLQEMLPV
jgi:twinkle protein